MLSGTAPFAPQISPSSPAFLNLFNVLMSPASQSAAESGVEGTDPESTNLGSSSGVRSAGTQTAGSGVSPKLLADSLIRAMLGEGVSASPYMSSGSSMPGYLTPGKTAFQIGNGSQNSDGSDSSPQLNAGAAQSGNLAAGRKAGRFGFPTLNVPTPSAAPTPISAIPVPTLPLPAAGLNLGAQSDSSQAGEPSLGTTDALNAQGKGSGSSTRATAPQNATGQSSVTSELAFGVRLKEMAATSASAQLAQAAEIAGSGVTNSASTGRSSIAPGSARQAIPSAASPTDGSLSGMAVSRGTAKSVEAAVTNANQNDSRVGKAQSAEELASSARTKQTSGSGQGETSQDSPDQGKEKQAGWASEAAQPRADVNPPAAGIADNQIQNPAAAFAVRPVTAPDISSDPTPFASPSIHAASDAVQASEPMNGASAAAVSGTPSTGAVQQIAVRIARPDAQPVELQITQRGSEVNVSVHTPDSGLQTALRQDLGTLVNSLGRAGYQAETFTPHSIAARAAVSSGANSNGEQESQPGSGGRSGSGGSSGGKQQQGQRQQRQRNWREELEQQS